MSESLTIVLCVGLIVCSIVFIASWTTHLSMMGSERGPKYLIRFGEFLKLFKEHEWERKEYRDSFFGVGESYEHYRDNYIHASIIRFDGKNRFFLPLGWALFLMWSLKNRKPKTNRFIWRAPE